MRDKVVVRIRGFHFKVDRIDNHYMDLVLFGKTKDGEGKSYEIHFKIPFSWTGYFIKQFRKIIMSQIERFKSYLE